MRKMWGIALCVVLAGGFGLGMVDAPATAQQPIVEIAAPEPDATFGEVKIADDDLFIGRADAPVTIVEYASLTCPHCARFHTDVLPKIKKDYIDAGKVRLIYRDYPLDRSALAASVLARCAGRDRFFGFLDVLYRDQLRWARSRDPMRSLGRIARLGGLTQAKFDACLKDEKLQNTVLQQRLEGSNAYQVNSTPTLIINGRKYSAALTYAQIKAILDPMLPKS